MSVPATEVKLKVTLGFITIVMVVVVAHCPAVGVKVYVVVAVLFIAGDQVPIIAVLLVDVVGNVKVWPEQIGAIGVNVGVVLGFTTTVIVVVVAHCPAVGVNVYVVVVVVFIAGDQVPLIAVLLFEAEGNVKDWPGQIGEI
mgnify:FL=1